MSYINNLILNENEDEKRCEISLLNSIYLYWINKDKCNKDYLYSISPISILLMFKRYIMNYERNIYMLCTDHIDKRIRYYYLSNRFLKRWITKIINSRDPVNTEDLELNTIDELNKYYINYIDFKEKKRYLFSENDFQKIVINCLQNSYEYDIEPDPMNIRNPYTNKDFTKTELRSLNNSVRDMPIVWNMFVDSDFDILKLKFKYYSILLEICIPNYVDKLGDSDIIDYLTDIFIYSNITYCKKCIIEKKNIRSRKVKNIIVSWIKYLKLNRPISVNNIENLKDIYSKTSCFHVKSLNPYNNLQHNSWIKDIDFTKPLFSIGYTTKKDKKLYWKKKREQNKKKRSKSKNYII